MLYSNYTEVLLGLEDVLLKSVEIRENKLFIHIEMFQRMHKCPVCGEVTSKIRDYSKQKIKVIKRNAFGIQNFNRFRNRILHVMA